jgi:hypothetical protein
VASETLNFNILARDNASRTFDRVGRSASNTESTFHKVGRGMLAVGKAAAIGLAGGAVAGAFAFRKMNEEAREAERVGRLTEAIIKSTGGAAKISARQVAELAGSISNKTGIDDEAIQTGSNLLLTFKNVRNEVGKGADIFNQATLAAVDLSAAGFGSIESSSKMLGKALNDPIAGITALSRAGVTFTEQQKEQIKTLVESGDTLKAQKLIMQEVQSQVGGAAAATATGMDKLKVTVANLAEEFGTALLPHIDRAADWLSSRLPGAVSSAAGFFRDHLKPALGNVADFITNQVIPALGQLRDFITTEVVPRVQSFVRWVRDELVPALRNFANDVAPGVRSALGGIADSLDRVSKAFDTGKSEPRAYGNTLTAVFNNIGPIIGGHLRFLGDQIKLAGVAFEVSTLVIRTAARKIAEHISDMVATAIGALTGLVRAAANVADALGMDSLAGKLRAAGDRMENFKWRVQAALSGMGETGRSAGTALGQGLAAGIAASGEVAIATARNTVNRINAMMRSTAEISSPSKVTIRIGQFMAEGLAIGLKKGTDLALEGAKGMIDKVTAKLSELRSKATEIRRTAADAVRGALDVGGLGATTTSTDADGNEVSSAARVTDQVSAFKAQSAAFSAAISAAVAKGVNSKLITQVANLGPTQGLVAAQALAAMSAAEVNQVNADLKAADQFAAKVGATVLTTTSLPEDIKRQQGILDTLKEIKKGLASGKTEFHIHDATDPDRVVAAIRRYVARNGKLHNVSAD